MSAFGSQVANKQAFVAGPITRSASIADQVADIIRNLIITGELSPGDRIVESRFARQLSVGQPTVREALLALEHQGLVVRRSNQGCTVTKPTAAEVSDILRIRALLEGLAVELAVDAASDAEIEQLVSMAESMKVAASERNVNAFFAEDFCFHEHLWKISGDTFLPRMLAPVMLPLLAFLFLSNLRRNSQADLMAGAYGHLQIAKAIATRDKKTAGETVQNHLGIFADRHKAMYVDGKLL